MKLITATINFNGRKITTRWPLHEADSKPYIVVHERENAQTPFQSRIYLDSKKICGLEDQGANLMYQGVLESSQIVDEWIE